MAEAKIKKQKGGKFSVRVGNSKYNGLTREKAEARARKGETRDSRDTYSDTEFSRKALRNSKPSSIDFGSFQGVDKAIPATDIGAIGAPKLPEKPGALDPGNVVTGNNAGLASMMGGQGYTIDETGQFVFEQPEEQTVGSTDASGDNMKSIFKDYLSMQTAPPDTASIYAKEEKAAGIKQKQQEVSNYTSQLNSIVAKSQADQLSVEGQGRGIPEVIIGGQQAQINKEAAIAALPIQALLSAAQGNLEMAQAHVDKMFQIKSADAQAQYQYKNKVIDSIFDFATKQEQRRLDDLKIQNDRKYQSEQDFLKTQSSLLMQAVSQGAPQSVVNAITSAKDTNSAIRGAGLYAGDILDRQYKQAQINKLNQESQQIADEADMGGVIDVSQLFGSDPNLTTYDKNITALTSVMGSKKVSAANRTTIGNALALSNAANDLVKANEGGKFTGFYPARGTIDKVTSRLPFGIGEALKRSKTIGNESAIATLQLQTEFWASGAALSAPQTELVLKMVPKVTDTDRQVKEKTNQLVNYMISQTASRLGTDGIRFVPQKVDLFETYDLISQASPEQLAELQSTGLYGNSNSTNSY